MDVAVSLSPSTTHVTATNNNVSPQGNAEKLKLIEQLCTAHQIKGKRFHRKRRHSVAEEPTKNETFDSKTHPAKHRRQHSTHFKKYAGDIILPTNFLLGGNITDPLNLNSLLDENVNKALNAVTPSSSPLPPRSSKINIVIPTDMTDPLGLNLSQDEESSETLTKFNSIECFRSSQKKKKKRRKSQHDKSIPSLSQESSTSQTQESNNSVSSNQKENLKTGKNRRSNSKLLNIEDNNSFVDQIQDPLAVAVSKIPSNIVDPVVSPVVPQNIKRSSGIFSPKAKKRKSLSQSAKTSNQENKNIETLKNSINHEKSKSENEDNISVDENLLLEIKAARLQSNVKSKVILPYDKKLQTTNNVGKSSSIRPATSRFQYGNYTKYYGYRNPNKFQDSRMDYLNKEWFKDKDVLDVGCNVGHLTLLIARDFSPRKIVGIDIDEALINCARKNVRHYATSETKPPPSTKISKYPDSMQTLFGPIIGPPIENAKDDNVTFPNNVIFLQGNYVPEKEEVLQCQEPEYDVILCMSVTKWFHLNWGDEGLIKTFNRFYKQLRPGGKLILEPQDWKSYSKKKSKLTQTIYDNYYAIKLKPDIFPRYLIDEVGFEKVEFLKTLDKPDSKGFQRSIQLYHKPE